MNLEITNCNNFFKVKGSLNKDTLETFKTEFKNVFNRFGTLTISIEAVESIDKFGVNALTELHQEAIAKNKSLAIIGLGCKDLYNHFKSQVAA
tara:strand:+ start:2518 stop:2796 length:279 start_codon:yes stop_codon:yes gene_type:complete